MNAPERYDKFVVPEGTKKIEFQKDTKLKNAGTFVIQREDHTVGNTLRMKLLDDKRVLFAGYKMPHPLENRMIVKVQTNGLVSPVRAVEDALLSLSAEFYEIREQFEREASNAKARDAYTTDAQQPPQFPQHY